MKSQKLMFSSTMMIVLPAVVMGYNGKATFYNNPNYAPGSCGFGFSDSEFIAALSGDMMHGYKAPYCNRMARVEYKGKSVTVKIVDTCPTCENTSLDLSPAAFQALEHPDVGLIDIKWEFIDGHPDQEQNHMNRQDKEAPHNHKVHDKPSDEKKIIDSTATHGNEMHHGKIMWGENPNNESGSCGTPYSDNDLVVAISKKLFDSSKCGKMINVYAGEIKASVRMVDSCESCDIDALVLSKGAFKIFSDLEVGMFDGKWTFSKEDKKTSQDDHKSEQTNPEVTKKAVNGISHTYGYGRKIKEDLVSSGTIPVRTLACFFVAFFFSQF